MENKNYIFNTKNYYTFSKASNEIRPCVIIVPGGGYHHTSDLEAYNVANRFLEKNIHACVLKYREELLSYPEPQRELAYTIDIIRKNPIVDENKIICIGFSAGGHLALSNACFYKEYGFNSRPNYLVLCYPVISSKPEIAHMGSFEYLLGEAAYSKLRDKLSLEDNLPSDLCDVFLWHNITDESVSVLNSLELMKQMSINKLNYEAHLFPEGCHGMSLSDYTTGINDSRKENKYIARWTDMMFNWLEHKLNN